MTVPRGGSRRRFSALLLLLSGWLLGGCSPTPQVTAEDVHREAEAQFNRAAALLNEGEILGSWRAMQAMDSVIEDYLMPGTLGHLNVERSEERVMDRPLREWQEEWTKRYGLHVQTAWPILRQAIEDESVDISLLKGFVSEFVGRKYVRRINEEYRRLRPVFQARRAQQYWYTCQPTGELCGLVQEAIEERMPKGTMTSSWTGDRNDYRGVIEVEVQVVREATYKGKDQRTGTLPESSEVIVSVKTRAGSSQWDGRRTFTVKAGLPARIAPHEFPRVSQNHWENLRRDLEVKLADWPSAE